ncbi:MAG: WGR domain-containing protein [Kofleriaceae bacterium]
MPAKRYFEFSEGSSNKFWEVWRQGAEVFTRYGKIGANGQLTVKHAGSDGRAKQLHDKLVGEKTGKGYIEGGAKPKSKAANKAAVDDTETIVIPPGAFRLEIVERKAKKFWQIQRIEKTVHVTFGAIGTAGQSQKKKHKDEWTARSDFNKQLDDKKKQGYQLVLAGPRSTAPAAKTNPALEQAILKHPDDHDGYMVYSDWLQEQGDPRGELAGIQVRLAKRKDTKLANTEKKLLWDQRAYFYGPLAVYVTKERDRSAPATATWRDGWIDSLRLSAVSQYSDTAELPRVSDCAELVRLLPAVASARLARELVIGCPRVDSEFHFGESIKALAKSAPALPNLRRLVLGDFTYEDSELSWSHLGKADALWPSLAKLEYLKIHAGSMDLGKIHLPELRELRIETGGLDKKSLAAIANASWPKLETLNLWFGQDNYGCDCQPKDVLPLLDGKKLPKLKHLGIANTTWGNELAALLPKARILKQLETLDISMSHLTYEGVKILADNKAAFTNLKSLDLSRCLLDKPAQKLARTLCKNVDLSRQNDPSDHVPEEGEEDSNWWRYSAVGE